jgi:hypothetical protein
VKLNTLQQRVLGIGLAFLAASLLIAPWTFTLEWQAIKMERSAGYSFLFWPPVPPKEAHPRPDLWGVKVDVPRLVVTLAVVVLSTIGGVILTGNKSDPRSQPTNAPLT